LGQGAQLNNRPIRVSAVRTLQGAAVGADVNSRDVVRLDRTLGGWRELLLANVQLLRVRGSAALELCSVAAGRLDAHFEDGLDVWDVCAAGLIVREAGGEVWDADGAPLQLAGFQGYVHAANSAALGERVRALVLRGADAARLEGDAQRREAARRAGATALLLGFAAGVCVARALR